MLEQPAAVPTIRVWIDPGEYVASVVATDDAGNRSAPEQRGFSVR